jgi:lysophospholipase L1-like esterase
MRRPWLISGFVLLAGCSTKTGAQGSGGPADASVPAAPGAHEVIVHDVRQPGEAAAGGAAGVDAGRDAFADGRAAPVVAPKPYRTVVHTGDSMVGGGLCKALAPKFKAEGTKFVRDVWESASISAFDDSDRIPTLMKRYNPDLVLLTLGANDVFSEHPAVMSKHIESIVKKIGPRDCVWVGPPLWKGDKGLVEIIRAHAAPCRFFDSQHLVLQRAGDGIHPTEKGGEVWAEALWPFIKRQVDADP